MSEIQAKGSFDIHQLLLKLERHQGILRKFSSKLSSYTCEPTDYNCFVKVGKLKFELKSLISEQQNMLDTLRSKIKPKLEHLQQIKVLYERFGAVEQEIAAYILATNQYH